MLHWLQRLLDRRKALPAPAIAADSTGFTLTLQHHSRAVPWESVSRIAAFKQDLHSCDQIVLLVEVAAVGDPLIRISEDCPGFATLFGPMEQALGINPSWYLALMTPAREPTPVVLYLRSEGPDEPLPGGG